MVCSMCAKAHVVAMLAMFNWACWYLSSSLLLWDVMYGGKTQGPHPTSLESFHEIWCVCVCGVFASNFDGKPLNQANLGWMKMCQGGTLAPNECFNYALKFKPWGTKPLPQSHYAYGVFHILLFSQYFSLSVLASLCQQVAPLSLAGAFTVRPLQVSGNSYCLTWQLSMPSPLCPHSALVPVHFSSSITTPLPNPFFSTKHVFISRPFPGHYHASLALGVEGSCNTQQKSYVLKSGQIE